MIFCSNLFISGSPQNKISSDISSIFFVQAIRLIFFASLLIWEAKNANWVPSTIDKKSQLATVNKRDQNINSVI